MGSMQKYCANFLQMLDSVYFSIAKTLALVNNENMKINSHRDRNAIIDD